MPSSTSVPAFSDLSELIKRDGEGAVRHEKTLVGSSGVHRIYFTPFSYVERRARIAIIGITPGKTQLEHSYAKSSELLRAGMPEADILREVKVHASFVGSMRPRLLKMLRHFDFASLLGILDEEELWGASAHLLHCSSIVPHAAFANGKMFNGSFSEIQRSPSLFESFERDFVPELRLLSPDTIFVALGDTPLDALDYCAAQGLISPERILGAFTHPSGSGGSQVAVYVGEREESDLAPADPVRHRVDNLRAQAERMRKAVASRRGDGEVRIQAAPHPRAPLSAPSPLRPEPMQQPPPRTDQPLIAAAPAARPSLARSPVGLVPTAGTGNDALHVFVSRGMNFGARLTAHVHKDGCYVVSPSKFKKDYIRVRQDESLESYLRRGFSLRMSAPGIAPSLFLPSSIHGRGT